MVELRADDAAAFMDRWGEFHDASIRAVEFDIPASRVSLALQAQDKTADWAWRELRIAVEGLSEYAFRQPPRYEVRTVFEAALIWDGATALLSLDAPPSTEATPERFRASDTYFGGTCVRYDVRNPVVRIGVEGAEAPTKQPAEDRTVHDSTLRMPDHEAAPSEIPVAGGSVEHIEFYGGLLYIAFGGPNPIRLQISGEFSLTGPDGDEVILNTENRWMTMAALLALQYLPTEALTIDLAVLRLRVGGWSLAVGPDEESWEFWAPTTL